MTNEGQELFKQVKNKATLKTQEQIDPELEVIKYKLARYDEFREKVFKEIFSDKMVLPDWLNEISDATVAITYGPQQDQDEMTRRLRHRESLIHKAFTEKRKV